MTRADGRAPDELRPVTITVGWQETAYASALIQLGRTKVVCAVTHEERTPPFLRGSGKGWVTAEYSMLPGATSERSPREVARGRPGGRTHEIQRLIGRSLRAVIDMQAFGESTLWVDCDVLQADGGTRCAAITGAWVALFAACHRMVTEKRAKSFPLHDHVAAVVSPRTESPWRMIAPAPRKPIPVTTCAAIRVGSARTMLPPETRKSRKPYAPAIVNSAAPTDTSMCVRNPASRSRISRSIPTAPPSAAATASRRSASAQ